MEKSSNKLVDLSVTFAVEILNLVKYLKSLYYCKFIRGFFHDELFLSSDNIMRIELHYKRKTLIFFLII